MENQYKNIANIQLHISENCPELEKEILQFYWEMEDLKFTNTPKKARETYKNSQGDLTKLNAIHSKISLYVLCNNCISHEKHIAKSHSKFKEVLKLKHGRYAHSFKCNSCIEQEQVLAEEEKEKKNKELIDSLKLAIENQNWNNLSKFEKTLLVYCLEKTFNQVKNHYGKLLGEGNFYQLIRALENIEAQHLITLQRGSWNNYITNFQYLDSLENYKEEINFTKKLSDDTAIFEEATNTLKLKLTINELQNHPDSPQYAGTIKFKEKIVIEPDLDYIFGLWKRANNNLYLTLTPQDELAKLPSQKRVSSFPVLLQKGITDFLNNMSKNIDF